MDDTQTSNIYDYRVGSGLEVVPRINKQVCFKSSVSGGSMINILPDLSNYQYQGAECGRLPSLAFVSWVAILYPKLRIETHCLQA